MKKKERKNRFTDHPLTPFVLSDLGVIKHGVFSGAVNDKAQIRHFIIWTTDGYAKEKNKILGELISRVWIKKQAHYEPI